MAVDTEKYRRRLLAERDNLKRDIVGRTELPPAFEEDGVLDSADSATRDRSTDLEGRLTSMKSDRLEQINAALQRIERGDYGFCVKCGKEIDPKRLDAEPVALTCVERLPSREEGGAAPTM